MNEEQEEQDAPLSEEMKEQFLNATDYDPPDRRPYTWIDHLQEALAPYVMGFIVVSFFFLTQCQPLMHYSE